ncbi:hypothetical protein C8Q74DRAFT_1251747 [Fomes fomentarius]|nr:hypothetical protein C8Q74DRAFT_1251747 [Fomes fomentarius]
MSSERVFWTCYSGYVDGVVLSRLLQHPDAGKFGVVALVRNSERAQVLESKFGVKTVWQSERLR